MKGHGGSQQTQAGIGRLQRRELAIDSSGQDRHEIDQQAKSHAARPE